MLTERVLSSKEDVRVSHALAGAYFRCSGTAVPVRRCTGAPALLVFCQNANLLFLDYISVGVVRFRKVS